MTCDWRVVNRFQLKDLETLFSLYLFQSGWFCLINLRCTLECLDRNYHRLHLTIGRVHIPAEPIHTAGRVYRHFVNLIPHLAYRTRVLSQTNDSIKLCELWKQIPSPKTSKIHIHKTKVTRPLPKNKYYAAIELLIIISEVRFYEVLIVAIPG